MTINLSDITTLTIFRSGLKKHLIGIERPDGILLLSDVDSSSEEIFFMPAT